MSKYSTFLALSNCKNSLKSGGRIGVAIESLSYQFDRPQAFLRRLGLPVQKFVIRFGQRDDRKYRFIHLKFILAVHIFIVLHEHKKDELRAV